MIYTQTSLAILLLLLTSYKLKLHECQLDNLNQVFSDKLHKLYYVDGAASSKFRDETNDVY
jgi:hypothetical protein